MKTVADIIDGYLSAYSEPDRERRRIAVAEFWESDGELIDPPLSASGHESIVAQADLLLTQFPGHRFQRSSVIDVHHDHARYTWRLVDPTGETALEGIDFAQIRDAKLRKVVGFFGLLSEL